MPIVRIKAISIVIVNWNGERWLRRCLDSLRTQSLAPGEVIIVDNQSSDGSVALLESVYPEIRLIHAGGNLGFAGGNNLGIQAARGSHILLLNSDVWVEDAFLEKLCSFYENNSYDVVGPLEADYDSGARRRCYRSTIDCFGWPVYPTDDREDRAPSFYLTGVCILFSRQMYYDTHGLDADFFMYCEEVDWFWRLLLLGKTFAYDAETFVFHAGRGSVGRGLRYTTFLWRNQNTLQMLLKNYKGFTLTWILPLYLMQNLFDGLLLCLKPRLAWSYVEAWGFNLKLLRRTMAKRKWIQANRVISDRDVFNRMYKGSGRLQFVFHKLCHKRLYEGGDDVLL
jgi:GT2 family glycosyltransferase